MYDIYKNIEEYYPNNKLIILILFDDMIPDMLSNKKLKPTVIEVFIRGRKLKTSYVFITQSYFAIPKNIRVNSPHYFALKLSNKRELQQIAFNHSLDIDFQHVINIYKKYTENRILFWLLILLLYQIILYDNS